MSYNHVIVSGSVAYDEIMDFPSRFIDYLQKDKLHQINVSFVVDKLEKQLGGTATNITYSLRLLINNKINIVSAVGRDGNQFIRFFKKHNIDTSGLVVNKKLYTATGKVITDKSDNQIWGYYYGPLNEAKQINISSLIEKKSLLVISATEKQAFLKHLQEAINSNTDFMFDPGMSLTWIDKNTLRKGMNHCRWLVGNDYEISQIFKMVNANKKTLIKKGVTVITTLGGSGVQYESNSTSIKVPAFKKIKMVDPTGAGDAWRGGFIAGIIGGYTALESLIQANALASFAIEKYGTVNHKPTKKMIVDRSKKIRALL